MEKIIRIKKIDILEQFAKRIPNAEKMFVDNSRDDLLIQFDGIHGKNYSINTIVNAFVSGMKENGYKVEIIK
jgi:hypothetical protein